MHPSLANKRNQLLLLAGGALGTIGLIWFFLISPMQASLKAKAELLSEARTKLQNARRTVRLEEEIKGELEEELQKLEAIEQGVAHGDVYRWIVNALLAFEDQCEVDFSNFEQPVIGDLPFPPKVPYKAASLTVTGVGTYHNIGRFLLAFERRYSLVRLQSLSLEPAAYVETDPRLPGRLTFRLGLVLLVKPGTVEP